MSLFAPTAIEKFTAGLLRFKRQKKNRSIVAASLCFGILRVRLRLMRKFVLGMFLATLLFQVPTVHAVSVSGYYKSNGTYVQSYERTAPDGDPYNNYSYPGNYNPNTGNITGGNPDTYLSHYYDTSGSSYSVPTPSYSYPTIPSCPLNSYYDGSFCTCDSGYVVGTDYLGSQSCVSGYTKCTDMMGYGAQYNSTSNTCSCGYGYVESAGKCVSGTTYCTDTVGLMSEYNSATKQCECMSGYEYDGSSCVYKETTPTYYPTATYTASAANAFYSNCPSNSHQSSTDSTKCQCDTGYQPDSTNSSCVVISAPVIVSPANSGSKLTAAQESAIISLLQSFGADASVIANVETSLGR